MEDRSFEAPESKLIDKLKHIGHCWSLKAMPRRSTTEFLTDLAANVRLTRDKPVASRELDPDGDSLERR